MANPQCGICAGAWLENGFRCEGLTHFVCAPCVERKMKKLKRDAVRKARAKQERETFETL